jgi:hypothetical protein
MKTTRASAHEKRMRFAAEYIIDLNATRAYKRAGYTAKGHCATKNASELVTKPDVQAEIARLKAERAARVTVTQDFVIGRLLIESQHEGEGSSHAARVRAVELLGKHLGMFAEKPEKLVPQRVRVNFILVESREQLERLTAADRATPVNGTANGTGRVGS